LVVALILLGDHFDAAWQRACEAFREAAEAAVQRGVTLCIEALSPAETNFINTVEEAVRMAEEVAHPAVGIMLDVKAMASMPGTIVEIVRRYGGRAKHFHANDPTGKGPGMNGTDFRPILAALAESGFGGWVSVEPFDYAPDPDTVARTALQTLRAAVPGGGS